SLPRASVRDLRPWFGFLISADETSARRLERSADVPVRSRPGGSRGSKFVSSECERFEALVWVFDFCGRDVRAPFGKERGRPRPQQAGRVARVKVWLERRSEDGGYDMGL